MWHFSGSRKRPHLPPHHFGLMGGVIFQKISTRNGLFDQKTLFVAKRSNRNTQLSLQKTIKYRYIGTHNDLTPPKALPKQLRVQSLDIIALFLRWGGASSFLLRKGSTQKLLDTKNDPGN